MIVNRDLQCPEKVFVTSEVESVRASDVQIENNIIIARQKICGSWCNYEGVTDSITKPRRASVSAKMGNPTAASTLLSSKKKSARCAVPSQKLPVTGGANDRLKEQLCVKNRHREQYIVSTLFVQA